MIQTMWFVLKLLVQLIVDVLFRSKRHLYCRLCFVNVLKAIHLQDTIRTLSSFSLQESRFIKYQHNSDHLIYGLILRSLDGKTRSLQARESASLLTHCSTVLLTSLTSKFTSIFSFLNNTDRFLRLELELVFRETKCTRYVNKLKEALWPLDPECDIRAGFAISKS